ncbi:hypothetical protein [Vibrio intestinalis]|uniref:hypothetical protein n=1 Tax=Vibrio intestinalis TaxID=2933291 RepID=UPI0021A7D5E5|nr:hypothetical protein [Vibrio intestinalis]
MKSSVGKVGFSLFLALTIAGCKSTPTVYPTGQRLLLTGDTLIYEGMITGEGVLEAIRMVRQSDNAIKKLKITSTGGEMAVGMEFGYFVKENDLDVEVSEVCFSACANYILPAAKSVVINTNSLIGWHGGAKQTDKLWQQSVPKSKQVEFMTYLNRLRTKETAFFKHMGVDQQITTYGQTIENSCQIKQQTHGWYYTLEDLHRMGLKNITVKGSGLLNEIEYKDDGGQLDTTDFTPQKITSCLLESVFDQA